MSDETRRLASTAVYVRLAVRYLREFREDVPELEKILVPTSSGVGITASRVAATVVYPLQYMPSVPGMAASSAVPISASAEFKNFY